MIIAQVNLNIGVCVLYATSKRSDVSVHTTHAHTKYLRMCSPSEQKQRLEVGLSWQQGGLRELPVVWLCYARERATHEMNGSEGMRGGVLLKKRETRMCHIERPFRWRGWRVVYGT